MRLTEDQIAIICTIADRQLGQDISIRVYGSRLNPQSKGGDLDLLLESSKNISILQRAEFKLTLENELQIPIDVLTYQSGKQPSAFQSIALANSIPIEQTL